MYVTGISRNFDKYKNEEKKLKDCLFFMLEFMNFENGIDDEDDYRKAKDIPLQEFRDWCALLIDYYDSEGKKDKK